VRLTGPRVHGPASLAGVRLRAEESSRKYFTFFTMWHNCVNHYCVSRIIIKGIVMTVGEINVFINVVEGVICTLYKRHYVITFQYCFPFCNNCFCIRFM